MMTVFEKAAAADDLKKAMEDASDWLRDCHEPEAENALALLREAVRKYEDAL